MTLAELAERVTGGVRGDGTVAIGSITSIDDADHDSLTFAVDERYLRLAAASRAAAVLTEPALADRMPDSRKPLLVVASVRAALAILLEGAESDRPRGPFRHESAVVDPSAIVGPDVFIGPLVAVGPGAEIGADCVLMTGAVVGRDAKLGAGSMLHPRAMLLDRCVGGKRVVLQAGAVVGSDGFGYVFHDGRFKKIPQVGNVTLGDDVEIGANACIDRAQTGSTSIGLGTKIDNLVQIGHNVRIGNHCGFAAMVGIAGSATIGDYTVAGGQSAINGHITVGSRVRIAGNTMVWSSVGDGVTISGQPAQDHRDELRKQVQLRNLPKLFERVTALERKG